MILGCHVNFTNEQLLGSTKLALEYGANTFMFYTGAPQNTIRKEIDLGLTQEAHKLMQENNIKLGNIICHAPYIINLANNTIPDKWDFSINFLKQEIKRCEKLGIKYIVLHPGSAVGLELNVALQNIIDALNIIIKDDSKVMILLETMAGKGTECGKTLEEIKYILEHVNSKNIGVCLDTCHLNDAGYKMADFDTFLNQFAELIGIDKIHCVHLNDSKNPLNSHKDRHENIGFGTIGFANLVKVLNHEKLKDVPKILETPYIEEYPPYKLEIISLKNNKFNPNLSTDLKELYK